MWGAACGAGAPTPPGHCSERDIQGDSHLPSPKPVGMQPRAPIGTLARPKWPPGVVGAPSFGKGCSHSRLPSGLLHLSQLSHQHPGQVSLGGCSEGQGHAGDPKVTWAGPVAVRGCGSVPGPPYDP